MKLSSFFYLRLLHAQYKCSMIFLLITRRGSRCKIAGLLLLAAYINCKIACLMWSALLFWPSVATWGILSCCRCNTWHSVHPRTRRRYTEACCLHIYPAWTLYTDVFDGWKYHTIKFQFFLSPSFIQLTTVLANWNRCIYWSVMIFFLYTRWWLILLTSEIVISYIRLDIT